MIIKLRNRWRVLPGFQGGTDAAYSFYEAIGTILRNEIPNTNKYNRAFINITRLHVGCTKLQFGHRDVDISIHIRRRIGWLCNVKFQRFANDLHRVDRLAKLK
ncbi:MAG: hypothetical protein JO309_14230 [Pseudonocardiales bacterium]|nr:hypothetical protein [Pseudonocardiales bacterium]